MNNKYFLFVGIMLIIFFINYITNINEVQSQEFNENNQTTNSFLYGWHKTSDTETLWDVKLEENSNPNSIKGTICMTNKGQELKECINSKQNNQDKLTCISDKKNELNLRENFNLNDFNSKLDIKFGDIQNPNKGFNKKNILTSGNKKGNKDCVDFDYNLDSREDFNYSIKFGEESEIYNFEGTTAENMSFSYVSQISIADNVTRNLILLKYFNVTNATMEVTGVKTSHTDGFAQDTGTGETYQHLYDDGNNFYRSDIWIDFLMYHGDMVIENITYYTGTQTSGSPYTNVSFELCEEDTTSNFSCLNPKLKIGRA